MTTQHDQVFADLLRFIQTAHGRLNTLHETMYKVCGRRRVEGSVGGEAIEGGGTGVSNGVEETADQPSTEQRVEGFLPPRLEVPAAALIAGTVSTSVHSN